MRGAAFFAQLDGSLKAQIYHFGVQFCKPVQDKCGIIWRDRHNGESKSGERQLA